MFSSWTHRPIDRDSTDRIVQSAEQRTSLSTEVPLDTYELSVFIEQRQDGLHETELQFGISHQFVQSTAEALDCCFFRFSTGVDQHTFLRYQQKVASMRISIQPFILPFADAVQDERWMESRSAVLILVVESRALHPANSGKEKHRCKKINRCECSYLCEKDGILLIEFSIGLLCPVTLSDHWFLGILLRNEFTRRLTRDTTS